MFWLEFIEVLHAFCEIQVPLAVPACVWKNKPAGEHCWSSPLAPQLLDESSRRWEQLHMVLLLPYAFRSFCSRFVVDVGFGWHLYVIAFWYQWKRMRLIFQTSNYLVSFSTSGVSLMLRGLACTCWGCWPGPVAYSSLPVYGYTEKLALSWVYYRTISLWFITASHRSFVVSNLKRKPSYCLRSHTGEASFDRE